MEPRRDDGDDLLDGTPDAIYGPKPQWSPVVTTGTTSVAHMTAARSVLPQWSPVVTTGTTQRLDALWAQVLLAAMEPRRDDGDDR